jgi:hypothetical protein
MVLFGKIALKFTTSALACAVVHGRASAEESLNERIVSIAQF